MSPIDTYYFYAIRYSRHSERLITIKNSYVVLYSTQRLSSGVEHKNPPVCIHHGPVFLQSEQEHQQWCPACVYNTKCKLSIAHPDWAPRTSRLQSPPVIPIPEPGHNAALPASCCCYYPVCPDIILLMPVQCILLESTVDPTTVLAIHFDQIFFIGQV